MKYRVVRYNEYTRAWEHVDTFDTFDEADDCRYYGFLLGYARVESVEN